MKIERAISFVWALLLVAAVISLSSNWGSVSLDPSTGGQVIEVTGSEAFPVGSAFLGLQFAFLFVSFFIRNSLIRVVTGLVSGASFWLAVAVFTSGVNQIGNALEIAIEEATGISGTAAHSDLIVSVDFASQNYVFALLMGLLGAVLVIKVLVGSKSEKLKRTKVQSEVTQADDYTQLWDEQ